MTELVTVEQLEAIQIVRLNRPEKKNALTQEMYGAIADALLAGEADPAVAVHLLAGAGSDFSAGNDLNDFLSLTTLTGTPLEKFLGALICLTKPLVAAVKGASVGIGSTLLLHCDLVVAAVGTRFQFPFVTLGLVPEAASSMLLPRLAGYQRAAELLLLGEPFDAEKAQSIGLINRLVPLGEEEAAALDLARRLSARPARALRQTKALMKIDPEPVAKRIERERRLFEAALSSPELKEAVAAFRERRPASLAKSG